MIIAPRPQVSQQSRFRASLRALAAALGVSVALAAAHAGENTPANDDCATAFVINGRGLNGDLGTFTGSNAFASFGPAASCGRAPSRAVWYRYTAPGNGTLSIDTCGSSFDTVLWVLSGCGGQSLACNDDSCGVQSSLTIPVTINTTYFIRISGWADDPILDVGNYVLHTSQNVDQSNDYCANAQDIGAGTVNGSTASATSEGNGGGCGLSFHAPDVWYRYTATGNGTLNIDSCGSTLNVVLSAFSACPASGGTLLQCRDDPCSQGGGTPLALPVTQGSVYLIRVSGFGGQTGNYTLNVDPQIIPNNDSCSSAISVGPGPSTFTGTTTSATVDGSATCGSSNNSPDVWYRYTATGTGTLAIDTCGSNFDTVLSVHTGCPGNAANAIGCNDDNSFCGGNPARQSSLSVSVTQGATYLIRVSGFDGARGDYTLHVTPSVVTNNDLCAAATATVTGGTYTGSTTGYGTDGATNCGSSNASPDAWFTYTAIATGTLFVNSCGSSFDTVLSAHTACPGTAANTIECNDDNSAACGINTLQSALAFPITQGTTYLIRVSGFNGARGNYTLSIAQSFAAPSNDQCAGAAPIGDGVTLFNTLGSSTEGPIEGSCTFRGDALITKDLWYLYTAPISGLATASTCGSSFDTVVAAYPTGSCPGSTPNTAFICNDNNSDACGAGTFGSSVTFRVNAGNQYLIRVGGYNNASGSGVLTMSSAFPFRDNCADAFPLSEGTLGIDTTGATTDGPREDACFSFYGTTALNDLWYLYTPSCTGTGSLSYCFNQGDAVLDVYPNASCPTGPDTAIACANETFAARCFFQPRPLVFSVVAGNSYLVRIGGLGGVVSGTFTLSCTPAPPSCPADYNQDGVLNADDIADFITGYFNVPSDPATDFNADGVINADDLGDFITAYFNGCP